MAESDFDLKFDEMERDNLQRTISEIERARTAARPDARSFFETFLLNARGRVAQLDKKIKDSQKARESHAREQLAILSLAQKESALSAREKETYSGFLKEDFFTKADFGRLEEFYTKSWDRLSEHGKDEMSHRIWEGIRHHEYTFDQLPPVVREKEMERVHGRLQESAIGAGVSAEIPEKDREDFIRAYEAGKKDDAATVLDRESFKKAIFRDGNSKGVKSVEASKQREAESEQLLASAKPAESGQAVAEKPQKPRAIGNKDFSALNFGGMAVSETTPPVQPPLLTKAVPANERER